MARPPENDYPDEVVSDREIKPLTTSGSRLPTLYIKIAGAVGLLVFVGLQFFGGNNNSQVAESAPKQVFTPPVDTSAPLPRPQLVVPDPEPEPEPVQTKAVQKPLNLLEIERLKQMALLEEQKVRLAEAKARAEEEERNRRLKSPLILVDHGGTAPTTEDNFNSFDSGGFNNRDFEAFNRDQDPNDRNQINTNANERFLRDASDEQVVSAQAVRLANQDYLLTQGTFISGVTETMINSDLPGLIRAIVDKPIYGRTGKVIVVPKGSRLIGRYQSGVDTGQSRVYIVWTRLERPDGVVIDLGSPGTDQIGQGGLGGKVDYHFLERFGASTLFSAIGPVTAALLDNGNQSESTAEIIEGGRQGFNRSAEIILQDSINIPPTIRVPQGTEITIFVNRDLSFNAIQN